MIFVSGARIKEIDGEPVLTEPFKLKYKLGDDFYDKMGEILGDYYLEVTMKALN